MPPPSSEVVDQICPDPYSVKFMHESKWTFMPDVRKFPPGVDKNGTHEVIVTLTFEHKNVISSSLTFL